VQRNCLAAGALLLCRWRGSNSPFGPDSGMLQAGPTFAMARGRRLNSTDAALRSLEQRGACCRRSCAVCGAADDAGRVGGSQGRMD
jgi:hypothetical protein